MSDLFDATRSSGLGQDDLADLFEALLEVFANGSCYLLASAVAGRTGWPIAGFWRIAGDDRLVHAVIVDPRTGLARDILGVRAIASLRSELAEVVGALRVTVLPSIHSEIDEDELACLTTIAQGLPWMPTADPLLPFEDWRRSVIAYASARTRRPAEQMVDDAERTVKRLSKPF